MAYAHNAPTITLTRPKSTRSWPVWNNPSQKGESTYVLAPKMMAIMVDYTSVDEDALSDKENDLSAVSFGQIGQKTGE